MPFFHNQTGLIVVYEPGETEMDGLLSGTSHTPIRNIEVPVILNVI